MGMRAMARVHEVGVRTETLAVGRSGALNQTYGPVTRSLQCRVQPASDQEILLFDQRGVKFTHYVYFDYDPQLTIKNALQFGTRLLFVQTVKNIDERNKIWRARCYEGTQGVAPH